MTTLTYFPVEGRAWCIRAAFHIAGVPYKDKHIPFSEWLAFKPTTPFDNLPILTEEGKPGVLPQSNAILRYVGRRGGDLYPTDLWHAAHVDAFLDSIEEITLPFMPVIQARDDATREAAKIIALQALVPWLENAEKYHLSLKTQFLASDELSVADLKFLSLVKTVGLFGGSLAKHAALRALVEKITTNEKVVDFIKSTEH